MAGRIRREMQRKSSHDSETISRSWPVCRATNQEPNRRHDYSRALLHVRQGRRQQVGAVPYAPRQLRRKVRFFSFFWRRDRMALTNRAIFQRVPQCRRPYAVLLPPHASDARGSHREAVAVQRCAFPMRRSSLLTPCFSSRAPPHCITWPRGWCAWRWTARPSSVHLFTQKYPLCFRISLVQDNNNNYNYIILHICYHL